MEDAQSPPDGENQKGDHPRRTSLRLRDAEAVASTRRDMFGDGSLLDALAEGSLPPGEEQSGPDASSQALPVEDQGEPAPGTTPNADITAPEPQQGQASEIAQTLDDFIDSFPAEPPSQDAVQEPEEPLADSGLPAASSLAPLDGGAKDAGLDPHQPPLSAPERFQVSAIFEGLGREHPPQEPPERGEEEPGAGAPPRETLGLEPLPEADSLRMPSDGPGEPDQGPQGDGGPLAGAPLPTAEPTVASDYDASGTPPAAEQARTATRFSVPFFAEAPGVAARLAPSEWPPPDATPDGAQTDTDGPAPLYQRAAPFPEPPEWPPDAKSPGADAAPGAQPARLGPPPLTNRPEDAAASPFPAPASWPPFPEAPGAEVEASAPEISGLPPYIELPANPESGQPHSESLEPPTFPPPPAAAESRRPSRPSHAALTRGPAAADEAPQGSYEQALDQPAAGAAAQSFADPPAAPALPEARGRPRFHEAEEGSRPALESAERASVKATAKIAAEASATAQALDNLQRLLSRGVPPPQAPSLAQPQRSRNAHINLQADPAPFAHGELATTLPGYLPPEPASGKSIYLLGFLTGLVLSVLAGAALYFLISIG